MKTKIDGAKNNGHGFASTKVIESPVKAPG